VPAVCDKNDATWAFRVGYDGQHANPISEADNSRMSKPIGDSIAASLLYAVKSFIETDKQGDLDALFCQTYGSMSTTRLSEGAGTPLKPHSFLSILQSLIAKNILHVNMSAFESLFFKLNAEWFLTMESFFSLTEQDDQVAEEIINFVVGSVIDWHKKNPDIEDADCQKQWDALLKSMGPFRHKCKSIQIVYTDDGQILRTKEGGLSMEAWAVSCGGLGGILLQVQRKIATGSFD
jgi:hypothetical protein